METVVERPAALDVHKEQVTVCVRVPGKSRRREEHVAEFKTTMQGLLALRDWLKVYGVTQVAIEASGVYWKSPWAILEDEFECLLVNARHVKQVPGRKTVWGAKTRSAANSTFPKLRSRCSYRTCRRSPNRLCNRRLYIRTDPVHPAAPGDGSNGCDGTEFWRSARVGCVTR